MLLRLPGAGVSATPAPLEAAWTAASESTGGRLILVTTPKALAPAVDGLHAKLAAPAVAVNFEPAPRTGPGPGPGPSHPPPASARQLIVVRATAKGQLTGTWPLPEAYG